MKKAIFFVLAMVLAVAGFSQDKVINDPNVEARTVGSFHAIKVSNGIDLIIKQGSTEAVAVSAIDKEYRDRIKTEVKGGELRIYFDHSTWKSWSSSGKKLKAYVSFKELDKIDGSSGSQTTIDGDLKAGNLKIEMSSGAAFDGSVQASALTVDQSSGSGVKIKGAVQSLSVDASSGAYFRGYDLATDKCVADVSSGGSVQITVNKELAAEASSGGDIRYKGEGVITKISTGSGGSIKKNS
ncbi:MAG: DUF2807 domain-containing protein [Gemmatimonadaceae bacterium]|nr:DUF2807 domain-containing protein [Chitinophagaceae bacterium]